MCCCVYVRTGGALSRSDPEGLDLDLQRLRRRILSLPPPSMGEVAPQATEGALAEVAPTVLRHRPQPLRGKCPPSVSFADISPEGGDKKLSFPFEEVGALLRLRRQIHHPRRYIICAPHFPLGRSPLPLSHIAAGVPLQPPFLTAVPGISAVHPKISSFLRILRAYPFLSALPLPVPWRGSLCY